MEGVKGALTSKAIWGSVISFAAIGAGLLKIDLGDQTALVEAIAGLFGAIFAIYGRIVAVKKIG